MACLGVDQFTAGKSSNWNSEYAGAQSRGGEERKGEGDPSRANLECNVFQKCYQSLWPGEEAVQGQQSELVRRLCEESKDHHSSPPYPTSSHQVLPQDEQRLWYAMFNGNCCVCFFLV